jgi:hypothetical protein
MKVEIAAKGPILHHAEPAKVIATLGLFQILDPLSKNFFEPPFTGFTRSQLQGYEPLPRVLRQPAPIFLD